MMTRTALMDDEKRKKSRRSLRHRSRPINIHCDFYGCFNAPAKFFMKVKRSSLRKIVQWMELFVLWKLSGLPINDHHSIRTGIVSCVASRRVLSINSLVNRKGFFVILICFNHHLNVICTIIRWMTKLLFREDFEKVVLN
jgi:hypothetical protein